MVMLSRKRQLAAKIESQEGTAETLAAADAKILVEMLPKTGFEPEMHPRNPVRTSFSPMGDLTGKRPANVAFKTRLRGSGAVATEAEIVKYLRACGFALSALKSITIGAVASGPIRHLETVTGAGGGTGKVICATPNGTTTLYYVVLSGTIANGEVITGGTSGATATTGSAPADAGHVLLPISTPLSVPSLTMALYEDGIRKLVRGARGTAQFTFIGGSAVDVDFTFSGVEAGVTDVAMLSSVVPETSIEPVFLGVSFALGGVAMNFRQMTLDLANTLAQRDNPTDSRGILSYMISDRDPKGTIDPEMLPVTVGGGTVYHDFHGSWFAGTKYALDLSFGASAGNKFRFYLPQIQYKGIADEDRDGIQVAAVSFGACQYLSTGDDEMAILFL